MKDFILLLALVASTVAAALWSFMNWARSGFIVFDSVYLNFKPESITDPRFFPDFKETCQRVLSHALWPAWLACFAWMAATWVILLRTRAIHRGRPRICDQAAPQSSDQVSN